MDPNTALHNARGALAAYFAAEDARGEREAKDQLRATAATTLVDAFEALDGWLSKGGFLPVAWLPPAPVIDGLPTSDEAAGEGTR